MNEQSNLSGGQVSPNNLWRASEELLHLWKIPKPEEKTLDLHSSTETPLAVSLYQFVWILLFVDYYFIEVARLDRTTSEEVIL